ncbi:hypothetical protein N0V82_001731 [Gnomoniopsis sp. IMI 355080]|nr:hypothetical protein N0V82_001731 [Gnomoniopsis sp. IMI 355080]
MLKPPPAPMTVDANPLPGPAPTRVPSPTAVLDDRQVSIVITVATVAGPPTITALSSSLLAAQRTISLLSSELQQAQLASVSAVASAQSAAAASALSTVASVSSSAALALASASSLVANANAAAVAASRSADAAIANASSIQAQADLTQRLDPNRFTETQLAIAVVVSIIGTLALSLVGFLLFANYRERREQKRNRQLKELILRPNSANSSGTGDAIWDEVYNRRPSRRLPRDFQRPRMVQTTPPRGPPRMPVPQPPETIGEEREPAERPMSG